MIYYVVINFETKGHMPRRGVRVMKVAAGLVQDKLSPYS